MLVDGNLSDDWLVGLAREKNQDAIDCLFEKYDKLIYAIIVDLQRKKGDYYDFNELYQEGMLAFLNCLEKYDDEYGKFYFFAKLVIERRIKDRIFKINRDRKVLSLDKQICDDDNSSEYLDFVCEDDSYYGESELYEELIKRLDFKSRFIVEYKMKGYTYLEIAEILNTNRQWVYRKVNGIKNIIKDIIEKID